MELRRTYMLSNISWLWSLITTLNIYISLFCTAQGKVHHFDLVLTEKNFTRLCSTRSILVANESFPGPTLHVHKGDTAFINVNNQGSYGVTIHWHGVKQPRNSWSDGPEFITQCPIAPGSNFTYYVIFSTEEGTVWWHAHNEWTRATVHGAIIVYPAEGTTYPYQTPYDEQVFILGSWYEGDLDEELVEDLLAGSETPASDSYVINGQPGDLVSCSQESTYRRVIDNGRTYLFRIINAAMNAELFVAIADHNVTVVGMDGSYLKPFSAEFVVLSPGQTMDVLLEANQSPGHYYFAVRQYFSGGTTFTSFDKTNATAILMYNGNYTIEGSPIFPSSLPDYYNLTLADNFLSKLRSLASIEHPISVPVNISAKMFVVVSMNDILCPNASCDGVDGNKLASSLNNITFVTPTSDILSAYYRNLTGVYTSDFPKWPYTLFNFTQAIWPVNSSVSIQDTRAIVLNYNEEVELTFQATNFINTSENHPMHLHGYSAYVIGSGRGNFNTTTDPLTYNLIDPPYQNTIPMPRLGWVTIRFKASNPGVWYWHCHLARHLSWGMSTVLIVKNGGTPETSLLPPPDYMPPCQVPYLNEFGDTDNSKDE